MLVPTMHELMGSAITVLKSKSYRGALASEWCRLWHVEVGSAWGQRAMQDCIGESEVADWELRYGINHVFSLFGVWWLLDGCDWQEQERS